MLVKKVIIMNFEIESQAYQAFSEVKKLYMENQIKGEQMAVITHVNDGGHQFKIDDFIDFTGNDHTAKDSMIGMLIGILGGPLGILLGWFAGSLLGATKDAKEIQGAQTVFEHIAAQIGEGQTGLVLIAEEEDNRTLNQLIVKDLTGRIIRLDYEDVKTEIDAAQSVEDEAQRSAKKAWESNKEKKN